MRRASRAETPSVQFTPITPTLVTFFEKLSFLLRSCLGAPIVPCFLALKKWDRSEVWRVEPSSWKVFACDVFLSSVWMLFADCGWWIIWLQEG